jgi:hypothetical protein
MMIANSYNELDGDGGDQQGEDGYCDDCGLNVAYE